MFKYYYSYINYIISLTYAIAIVVQILFGYVPTSVNRVVPFLSGSTHVNFPVGPVALLLLFRWREPKPLTK